MSSATPHDDLFKAAFKKPRHAAGLLRAVLPAALVSALDWRTVRLESGALRGREGGERRNDLLFSVGFRDAHARAYLLVEHQSHPEIAMPLRGLGYAVSLWQRLFEAADSGTTERLCLPLIVPVLVSNAPRGWTAPVSLHDLLHPHPRELSGVTPPNLTFVLDDLFHRTDAELQTRPLGPFPKLALWALRDGRSISTLLRNMPRWTDIIREAALAPDRDRTFALLSAYIDTLHRDALPFEQFHAMLVSLVPEAEEPLMTYLEQLREESLQKGLQKGRHEGRVENARDVLRTQLTTKFGEIPSVYADRIEAADEPRLHHWLVRFVDAETIDAVFED